MRLRDYLQPNGKPDFQRMARVCAGWTNLDEQVRETEKAFRSVYQAGRKDPKLDDDAVITRTWRSGKRT